MSTDLTKCMGLPSPPPNWDPNADGKTLADSVEALGAHPCKTKTGGAGGISLSLPPVIGGGYYSSSDGCEAMAVVATKSVTALQQVTCVIKEASQKADSVIIARQEMDNNFSYIENCDISAQQSMDVTINLVQQISADMQTDIVTILKHMAESMVTDIQKTKLGVGSVAAGSRSLTDASDWVNSVGIVNDIQKTVQTVASKIDLSQKLQNNVSHIKCDKGQKINFDQTMVASIIAEQFISAGLKSIIDNSAFDGLKREIIIDQELEAKGVDSIIGEFTKFALIGLVILLVVGGAAFLVLYLFKGGGKSEKK